MAGIHYLNEFGVSISLLTVLEWQDMSQEAKKVSSVQKMIKRVTMR